jgi:organic hydroperoxide reductase OsmC/OhrA
VTRTHRYEATVTWTGDRGAGTAGYRAYDRTHEISAPGRPTLPGSADPAFRGEADRWSPEDLLVVSLSQCHLLWYLHLCAQAGIVVTGYVDHARGSMVEDADGGGHFTEVVLAPEVTVTDPARRDEALALHARAHELCYIARSVNFPVCHEPRVRTAAA